MNYKKEDLSKIVCKYTKETLAHKLAREGHIFPEDRKDILMLKDKNGWSVAHEMAKQGYNFKESNKEILKLKDCHDITVAHVMAFNGYRFDENNYEILSLQDDEGLSVAHYMVRTGYTFNEKNYKVLTLAKKDGKSVAHEMAEQGFIFTQKKILKLRRKNRITVAHLMAARKHYFDENDLEILKLADEYGWTVAHEMASKKYNFSENEMGILSLATDIDWTVAHEMASNGYKFPEDRKDILMLKDKNGWSVAHEMAKQGYNFKESNKEILKLKDCHDITVAHVMARNGYRFNENNYEILSLQDDIGGVTVAHVMASKGYNFTNKKILKLRTKTQETVAHKMAGRGYIFDKTENKDILKLSDKYGETVAHEMVINGYKFDINKDIDILQLKNKKGESVAFYMYKKGYIFPENRIDILSIADKKGNTIAHYMANDGYRFSENNLEVLSLQNKSGTTVAHLMVLNGYVFSNMEVWKICNKNKETVLEYILKYSNDFKLPSFSKDFLMQKISPDGETIAHILAKTKKYYFDLEKDWDIINATDKNGRSVAEYLVNNFKTYKIPIKPKYYHLLVKEAENGEINNNCFKRLIKNKQVTEEELRQFIKFRFLESKNYDEVATYIILFLKYALEKEAIRLIENFDFYNDILQSVFENKIWYTILILHQRKNIVKTWIESENIKCFSKAERQKMFLKRLLIGDYPQYRSIWKYLNLVKYIKLDYLIEFLFDLNDISKTINFFTACENLLRNYNKTFFEKCKIDIENLWYDLVLKLKNIENEKIIVSVAEILNNCYRFFVNNICPLIIKGENPTLFLFHEVFVKNFTELIKLNPNWGKYVNNYFLKYKKHKEILNEIL